jgi:hypothetical protein
MERIGDAMNGDLIGCKGDCKLERPLVESGASSHLRDTIFHLSMVTHQILSSPCIIFF